MFNVYLRITENLEVLKRMDVATFDQENNAVVANFAPEDFGEAGGTKQAVKGAKAAVVLEAFNQILANTTAYFLRVSIGGDLPLLNWDFLQGLQWIMLEDILIF